MFGDVKFATNSMATLNIFIDVRWTDKGKKEATWIEQPKIVNP